MILDLPSFASAFGRAMHDAGVPTTPERSVRFAQALSIAPPTSRDQLYWTARAVFVSARDQLDAFDRMFAAVFDAIIDPAPTRGDANAPSVVEASGAVAARGAESRGSVDDEDQGAERELAVGAASAAERLAERNFSELKPDELRALRELMRRLALSPPRRVARRRRRHHRGRHLDIRSTLRSGTRTGGDPARPVRRRRITRPRRLVLLCDISGSMEPYARAYLLLLHAAVGGTDADAFVFATRLTRLTRALRGRRPDLAIERAAVAARDWSSGTRLGESLKRFNDDYGRRGTARGAVVVIISDGWERGDPAVVGVEMERLRRLARRIVWVNPRKASPEFEPLAGGMAAALPLCDAFVSGHSFSALSEVAEAIGKGR